MHYKTATCSIKILFSVVCVFVFHFFITLWNDLLVSPGMISVDMIIMCFGCYFFASYYLPIYIVAHIMKAVLEYYE